MKFEKYLFFLLFLLTLLLTFLIIKPFITTIIAAVIIGFTLRPLYRFFTRHTRFKSLAAITVIVLFLLVVGVPFVLMAGKLTQEAYVVFISAQQTFASANTLDCEGVESLICNIDRQLQKYDVDIESLIERSFSNLAAGVIKVATDLLTALPSIGFHIFLFSFLLFFYFVDGEKAYEFLLKHMPISKRNMNLIEKRVGSLIHATIYGSIVTGILQGILAGFGFFLFGVESPIFWGALSILASFLPFVGTALIWAPIALKMFVTAFVANDPTGMLLALGLTIYSFIVVSGIDNIVKPKIIGKRAELHPVLILLGVFGGISFFGLIGLIIGPIILALFVLVMDMWDKEKQLFD